MDIEKINDHVGETRMANCGMEMTIIEYNGWRNVVVRFKDGYTKQTQYSAFIRGNIGNPNCRPNHVGETRMANCGMEMTIIEYKNSNNIVVKFEDGYTTKTQYHSFIHGGVGNPNCIPNHVG